MQIKAPPKPSTIVDPGKYLQLLLYPWLLNIFTGLRKLQFTDNFISFAANDVVITNGQTVNIPNDFLSRFPGGQTVPKGRIIYKQTGNGVISDGIWSPETVQMINNGPSDVTVSIIFFI